MALATSGTKGGEKLASKGQAEGVTLVLAKPNLNRNGRAAPVRAEGRSYRAAPAFPTEQARTESIQLWLHVLSARRFGAGDFVPLGEVDEPMTC